MKPIRYYVAGPMTGLPGLNFDAVVLLPGWEKSKGATLEHYIATSLEMQIHRAGEL